MTTPTGQISLSQVNTELGYSATAVISMNDAAVRTLAGVPSGAISMQNLQGKSNRVSISYSFGTNATDTSLNVSTIAGYSSGKSDITVTVNSGVYLYATSTSNYGLNLTGATTGDTLTLVNNGYIMGMGGKGGFAPASAPATGFPGGPALNIGIGINPTITNTSGYIAGGGGGGAGSVNNGYPPSGGGGGAGGGRAGNTNPPAGGNGGGPGSAGAPGNGGGGGGGRIIPGNGGTGAVAGQTAETGGGAGGGGSAYNWPTEGPPYATGGNGGGGSSSGNGGAANTSKSNAAGGGGGWGASGGTGNANGAPSASGGSGGKGINLNGKTITWTGGPSSSSRVYGSVS